MPPKPQANLSRNLKFLVVGVLYFAEGVPLGFVLTTLNFYLRGQGVPLQEISILSVLALAWSLKVLWGPLADRFGSRAAWLVPAQIGVAFSLLGLAWIANRPVTPLFWVLVGVLCLTSATQDLAVDAYTIDLLDTDELGLANGIRIGAYRVGLIASGGGLLMLSDWLGYQAAFVGLGVIMTALALTVLFSRPFHLSRPLVEEDTPSTASGGIPEVPQSPRSPAYFAVTGFLWAIVASAALAGFYLSFRQNWILTAVLIFSVAVAMRMTFYVRKHGHVLPYFGAIILFVMLYKLGDALLGVMVPPLWKDLGFSASQFGMAAIVAGKIPTIIGAILGGVLTSRWGISRALWLLGVFQAFSIAGFGIAALPGMGHYEVVTLPLPFLAFNLKVFPIHLATLGESLAGGMGSAAFMAFLMSLCDKRISASYYAYLAMLFGLSGRFAGYLGGWGAAQFGYATFFFLAFLAAWPAFALLPWVLPVIRKIEGREVAAAAEKIGGGGG
jgi:MFS transporter, PAT family, beta-lactamase induction signal transducer AmpG